VSLPPIDVAELLASASLEEHAARADRFFAGLDAQDPGFQRPFTPLTKAGPNLSRLGAMFEAAELYPGLRVLDFGCGIAWLGRALAAAGCKVVAADVAPTALAVAEAHDRRFRPALAGRLRYLRLHGTRIDLPDASLDRVMCHEALHHVVDQAATIAEFRRLLAPGGRAVFMEPGPEHSAATSSQDEMRRHGIIERDIHVEEVWKQAQRAGFAAMQVGLFTVRPEMLPIERFMALWRHERHGEVPPAPMPAETYRQALLPVIGGFRMFVLHAEAPVADPDDSRSAEGLAARIELRRVAWQGDALVVDLVITNTGQRTWSPSGPAKGQVNLGLLLLDAAGAVSNRNWRRHPCIAERLPPGGQVATRVTCQPPPGARLSLDLVAEHVAWFGQPGSGLEVPLPG